MNGIIACGISGGKPEPSVGPQLPPNLGGAAVQKQGSSPVNGEYEEQWREHIAQASWCPEVLVPLRVFGKVFAGHW
ncbi:MAG: hypothetical protein ACUVRS_05050 [Armatimonadota bacterium]